MTKKDEALKLALEGAANYIDALGGDSRKYRQALAEQPAQQQEPVGKWMGDCIEWIENPYKFFKGQPIYTSPPAQQCEPAEDGVCEKLDCPNHGPAQQEPDTKDVVINNMGRPFTVKAYVTPQPAQHRKPWVGLTNQELIDLTAIYSGAPLYCAIEAKLREKNQ